MKKFPIALALTLFVFINTVIGQNNISQQPPLRDSSRIISADTAIEVYFSPNRGVEKAVIGELTMAKESVLVLAYSFTSAPIAKALGQAKDRGVDVQVILDKSHRRTRYSVINYLQSHDIPVFIDISHAIAHNKVMIIDGRNVITGSYNFTSSAEKRNAENLVIIRNNTKIAYVYTREWHQLNAKSELAIPIFEKR